VKLVEREEARRLRVEDGMSIKAIAATVAVAPSTVSRWVRGIELTPEQVGALQDANPIFNGQRDGTAMSSANARARRVVAQLHGRLLAAKGNALHRLHVVLGEGHRKRNQVIFTNADPDMLCVFHEFLARCYDVRDEQVALTVNVHLGNGLTLAEIEAWWLDRLRLPQTCLRQSVVNRPSRASQRKRRTLPYGTVRLAVCSTFIVQSIYGAIQEYAGATRPEWIDLR
jgi:transposase-like protein